MSTNLQTSWLELVEFVPHVMEKRGVPGAVVGILHEGQARIAGFGVTHVEHPLPATEGTLFQIGSITKTFTATAVMRLVEMGKLRLDDTVRTYVPDFRVADPAASSQATVRHVLTHVGGWFGDFFHDTGAGDEALARYVADMAGLEQLAPLGTVWSYNNAAFSLAGYVIEAVTGKRYEAALRELVLEPLGMEQCFLDPRDVMTHRFSAGHSVGDAGAQVARPWPLPRAVCPAGGIVCSASDLLRYARFHLGDGTAEDGSRLLRPESLAMMQTPQTQIWKDEATGLAWFLSEEGGTHRVRHGGGTLGQVSLLTLVPEHHFAVAVLTNADRGGSVTDEVTRLALAHYLNVETPRRESMEASTDALATSVGRYASPGGEIELGMLCGRLVGQFVSKLRFPTEDTPLPPPLPPMSLTLCEKDRLLVLDGPYKDGTAEIVRKPDGSIGWLRHGLRVYARQPDPPRGG